MWAVFGAQLIWITWQGPTLARLLAALGVAMIAMAWNRYLGRRALWLTDGAVVIANSDETHIVLKAGAAATLVEEEWPTYRYRPKPTWDNSVTATRRLYVIPNDPGRDRVQVEAAQGLTPRKMRAVVDELESAFSRAS